MSRPPKQQPKGTQPGLVSRGNSESSSLGPLLAAAALAAAASLAYANSFGAPFIFDDLPSIPQNPTLRHLWPLAGVLHPPGGAGITVEGRPILNLSFALNYAISGSAVWSYHLVNLGLLITSAVTLMAIVRRTWARMPGKTESLGVAFAAALLWELHPLQTESVTYIVQRAESLMAVFYLLTLYAFIRAVEKDSSGAGRASIAWKIASWTACLLGMATKEVMVSAPLIVFLYDRTFVSGSCGAAARARKGYYLALAATWILLIALTLSTGNRGGTIGGSAGVTPWQYALSQSRALVHYLRLALWPSPLILDYGSDFVRAAREALPYAAVDVALLAATALAIRRRQALGFLGAWFFLILGPTSSFVGGTRQMLAEHRMYLSLAAVIVAAVAGLWAAWGRRGLLVAVPPLALALGLATAQRNAVYLSPVGMYRDIVSKRPENAWAQYNLGDCLDASGQKAEARECFQRAIRLDPNYYAAHYNLGNNLMDAGRLPEALGEFEAALRIKPDYVKARYNLGNVLVQLGRKEEAVSEYEAAIRLRPDYVEAQDNLGSVLFDLGRLPEAITHYQRALQVDPRILEAHYNLGAVLLQLGRKEEAAAEFIKALEIDPGFKPALEQLERLRR